MKVPELAIPTVPVAATGHRFPVHRIYCVGQNYADHAREMGSDPDRKPPFFFMKPADAVVPTGARLAYPSMTDELHHEVELVVALGSGGRELTPQAARESIFGWGVGIDLTRRDLQSEAKRLGRPWDLAKGFDCSAPVGALVEGQPPATAAIRLSVNGALRQSGHLSAMIWGVPDILVILSRYVQLAPGDLIFTGTPAGVGLLRRGDIVRGDIEGAPSVEVSFED